MMRLNIHIGVRLLAVLLFAACTRAEIYYPDNGIPTPATEGYIRIYPDRSQYTLPALQYHFYNTNTDVEYTVLPCDGLGNFEGMLPVGTYRVIATNTTAANVSFSGMQNHETATVTATRMETRSGTLPHRMETHGGTSPHYLAQPGSVYSTVLQDLIVSSTDTVHYDPAPALLTRTLNLVFTLMDGLEINVESLTGVLYGVCPSIYLYSHDPLQGDIDAASQAISFTTETIGRQSTASLQLFGLYNPDYGQTYTNVLELALTTSDGHEHSFEVDLTTTLSDIIAEYGYELPIKLSLPIEVRQTEIGITGNVIGWIEGGETELESALR